MPNLQATPYAYPAIGSINNLIGGLLGYMRDPRRTQQMQGLASLLEATGIPKTVERLAYDEPLTNIQKANVPALRPETADALMTLLPVSSGTNKAAMAAGRAGEQLAEKYVPQIMERGGMPAGLLQDLAQGSRSYAYRPSTPLKPDPSLGTRFEREFLGGLADKTPIKIEDYKGASIMLMPWDSTSRNFKITGISDEVLANPVITHGGQDYARDIEHINQQIAGASNLGIAKRIKDRDAMARIENINAGGTGEILHLPVTMGEGAENFSVMPVEVLLNFADKANLSKNDIKVFDESVRNYKVFKGTGENRKVTQPFKNFKGIMSEEGRVQMYSGEGLDSTPGELRKAIVDRFYMKGNQEKFGFNAEDVSAALTDEALLNVPKGYAGNTVILSDPSGMHLLPSANRTYNTNFTGQYQGTLGHSIPAEILMPESFGLLGKEFAGKTGDIRNMILGALEKRKEGVSEMIDDKLIEKYYKYVEDQKRKGLLD